MESAKSDELSSWLLSAEAKVPVHQVKRDSVLSASLFQEEKGPRSKWLILVQLYLFTIVVCSSPFLFGFHVSFTSQTLHEIENSFGLKSLSGIYVGQLGLGAILGAVFAGPTADRFGRRVVAVLDSLIMIAGTTIMILSTTATPLIIGRTLVGIGIGSASIVVPMYLSEAASSTNRGAIVASYQLCVGAGTLFAYLMGTLQTVDQTWWHYMLCIALVPAVVQFFGLFFFPESPQFLVKAGKIEAARKSVARMHPIVGHDIDNEIYDIQTVLGESHGTWADLIDARCRRSFLISIGLVVLQQMCGYWILVSYSTQFWKLTRLTWDTAVFASVGVGLLNVVGGVICLFLIDLVGRRKLLLYTIGPLWASLLVMTLYFVAHRFWDNLNQAFTTVPAIGVSLFVLCYSMGLGSVPWVMIAELFPLRVRGLAMAICMTVGWLCYYIIAVAFPLLINNDESRADSSKIAMLFGLFTLITFGGHVFVYFVVPETKDLSFIQIHRLLVGHYNYIGRTFRLIPSDEENSRLGYETDDEGVSS